MPRLTIVTSLLPPEQGGPAQQTSDLAEYAHEQNVTTRVVLVGRQKRWDSPQSVPVSRCPLSLLPVPGLNYLWVILYALYHCLRYRPHLIHTQVFGGPSAIAFVLVGKLLRISVYSKVSSERGVDKLMQNKPEVKRRDLLRASSWDDRLQVMMCDRLLATTHAFRRILPRKYGIASERVLYFPNFTTLPVQSPKLGELNQIAAERRAACGELLTVARGIRQKNFGACVQTAVRLRDMGVAFRWHILGGFTPAYEHEIREQIESAELTQHVLLCGKQPPAVVREYLSNADIFVMLSQFEWFGISVIEAMAANVAVIVNKVPGMSEIVASPLARVRAERPEEVAERIAILLTNPDVYHEQVSLANQRVARCYQVEHTGKLLVNWLRSKT